MRVLLVALLMLSVGIAGCGKKDDQGLGGETFKTPPEEDGAFIITFDGDDFTPTNAKVAANSIVEWRFDEGCSFAEKEGAFHFSDRPTTQGTAYNSGGLPAGSAWRWQPTAPGEYEYWCTDKKSAVGLLKVT